MRKDTLQLFLDGALVATAAAAGSGIHAETISRLRTGLLVATAAHAAAIAKWAGVQPMEALGRLHAVALERMRDEEKLCRRRVFDSDRYEARRRRTRKLALETGVGKA